MTEQEISGVNEPFLDMHNKKIKTKRGTAARLPENFYNLGTECCRRVCGHLSLNSQNYGEYF